MITTVFDCVSNDKDHTDSDMDSIGFVAEYVKGNSGYRERVNLVMATTDQAISDQLEPGKQYIVTFTERHVNVVGDVGDLQNVEEKS